MMSKTMGKGSLVSSSHSAVTANAALPLVSGHPWTRSSAASSARHTQFSCTWVLQVASYGEDRGQGVRLTEVVGADEVVQHAVYGAAQQVAAHELKLCKQRERMLANVACFELLQRHSCSEVYRTGPHFTDSSAAGCDQRGDKEDVMLKQKQLGRSWADSARLASRLRYPTTECPAK